MIQMEIILYLIPIIVIIIGLFLILIVKKIQNAAQIKQIAFRQQNYENKFFNKPKKQQQSKVKITDPIRLKFKIVYHLLNNVIEQFEWFQNLNRYKTDQDSFSNINHFKTPIRKLKQFLLQTRLRVNQIKQVIGFKWKLIQNIYQTLQRIEIIYDIVLERLVQYGQRGGRPNGQKFLSFFHEKDIQISKQFVNLRDQMKQLDTVLFTEGQCLKKCNKQIHKIFCDCFIGKKCQKNCDNIQICQKSCQEFCQKKKRQLKPGCQRKCHRNDIDLAFLSILKKYRGFSDNLINLLIKYCITAQQFYDKEKQKQKKILMIKELQQEQFHDDAIKLKEVMRQINSEE